MRYPPSRVLLAACLVVLLAGALGATAGAETPSVGPSDAATSPVQVGDDPQIDSDLDPATETRIRVDLRANGDARWSVVVRYEFTDANQTDSFEAVGERFVAGEIGPDPALFEGFAAEADRTVDREMSVVDVGREAVVIDDPETVDGDSDADIVAAGELRLRFTWTAFLAEDGENLVLGDAFGTPDGGTWLRSLEDGQTVVVTTPDGYTVSGTPGATLPLRDNAVVIEGPRTFGDEERVRVVYAPAPAPDPQAPPWTLLAGAMVLAALLIAGGLVGYRRLDPNGDDPASASTDGTGETALAAGGADSTARSADDADAASDDEPEEDLSLLSDEERVERLLERNGGRMRQADIVAETGWSDAKVSQLLSAMADAERVEKLRLGRENLISLPDGADSAFDADDESPGVGGGGEA